MLANPTTVERRRRETINEGINELAKIVPGCEKNKGSILQRAVQFITQLKENEQQNIEKWTLEKLLTEQAITELSTSCDKFKSECQRAWDECQIYKRACENNGIVPEEIKERQENGEQTGQGQLWGGGRVWPPVFFLFFFPFFSLLSLLVCYACFRGSPCLVVSTRRIVFCVPVALTGPWLYRSGALPAAHGSCDLHWLFSNRRIGKGRGRWLDVSMASACGNDVY